VASEEAYLGLLRSAGFGFVKRYARMRRELGADEPAPVAPPRVVVRPVRPDDEAEMRSFHEVLDVAFQDIPDYQPSTYEQYRQRLAALPSIEWDEWFVAEVDGEIAAILQSEGDEPDEGWVKYLGVRADHRGLGLGRLLLLTAFHAYAGKGRRAAGLGVDMTNPTGAYRLYQSVGMHSVYESDVYEREIVAA
jgi:ribosomal protein S18 acetylase RimI-like enzyme